MKTLLIYAHPYEKSFNKSLLNHIQNAIQSDFDTIDLYQDHFNLIYSEEELALFQSGKTSFTIVEDYQKKIKEAQRIVFIFPVWWNDIPGILKNFIDLVMKKDFAYVDTTKGVKGLLNHVSSVIAISTSNSPTWYIKFFAGNGIKSVFLDGTCKQLGIKKREWLNLGNMKKNTKEKKEKFFHTISLKLND